MKITEFHKPKDELDWNSMNQHEIHLDNIEQAEFPYDWKLIGEIEKWKLIEKLFLYMIMSIGWFLESFFALFSIKETIWWDGDTWSIERELSVPRRIRKQLNFCFLSN